MLLDQISGCAKTLLAHDGNAFVTPSQTFCQHYELMIMYEVFMQQ